MNKLVKTFFQGLLAFLPVFVTLYAVFAFGHWLNDVTSAALHWLVPTLPELPGLGIAVGVAAIYLFGLLVSSRLTQWIYGLIEAPLRLLPVVKDLYSALKQLTTLLGPSAKGKAGQVVAVRHPDYPLDAVGLMMRTDLDDLDPAVAGEDRVAVYLPMSYQIGGYTLFVPRAWVTPLDMSVESALRSTLTGWIRDDDPTAQGKQARARARAAAQPEA